MLKHYTPEEIARRIEAIVGPPSPSTARMLADSNSRLNVTVRGLREAQRRRALRPKSGAGVKPPLTTALPKCHTDGRNPKRRKIGG